MSGLDWTGIGIAVFFGFLAFAVREMPPVIAWGGVSFGVVLVVWKHLPIPERYTGPALVAAAGLIFCAGALAWALTLSGSSKIAAQRQRPVPAKTLASSAPTVEEPATPTAQSVPPSAAPRTTKRKPVQSRQTDSESTTAHVATPETSAPSGGVPGVQTNHQPPGQPTPSGSCGTVTSTDQKGGVTGCNFGTVNQGTEPPREN